MNKKKPKHLTLRWAFKRVRWYLKTSVVDFDPTRAGDMQYCLEKYFGSMGLKKPNKRAGVLAIQEFYRVDSPIYKEIRIPGLTLENKKRVKKPYNYDDYIKSSRWKTFKRKIVLARGEKCELCKIFTKSLDLHHKTYERLFNELPEDVALLCHPCHQKVHDKKLKL